MRPILGLSLCGLIFAATITHAQELPSLQPSRYSMQLTHILTRDGSLKTGWFLGTYADTLVAQIAKKTERISRRDLVRVDVERPTERSAGTLAGVLAGIYAGNALGLRAENQPFAFVRDESGGAFALYSALFGLVGGVIGNLVGGAAGNVAVFDFPADESANAAAWGDFVESNSPGRNKGTVHLSFQGGWIQGPLPSSNSRGPSYYYSGYYANAGSLNMVRKIQLTYSLSQFLDVGLAFLWLGQPSTASYSYSGGGMNISLEGTGRYAVAVVQPLWKLGLKGVQWDVGAGIGVASYDCQAFSPPSYYSYDSVRAGMFIEQKKTTFSTLIYTEVKVFPANFLSLGVAADWAYIPDRVPVVQGVKFESNRLGTTSIGFVLSFHI